SPPPPAAPSRCGARAAAAAAAGDNACAARYSCEQLLQRVRRFRERHQLARGLLQQLADRADALDGGVGLRIAAALACYQLQQQLLQGIARAQPGTHANSFFSVSDDSANGTSSPEDGCSSLRIGPMRSMAKSASGSLPRLYSPSCSSSSMSWCLASALRNCPAARRCAWSTTRGMVRLRLVSTSIAG